MSKKRKNISIDENLARIVEKRDEFNLSGFVNRCLEQHFAASNASNPETAALRAQLEEIEEELQEAQQKEQRLKQKREQVEEKLDGVADKEPEMMERAREVLDTVPKDPDNPAIQNWAGKLGITSEQLLQEIEQ